MKSGLLSAMTVLVVASVALGGCTLAATRAREQASAHATLEGRSDGVWLIIYNTGPGYVTIESFTARRQDTNEITRSSDQFPNGWFPFKLDPRAAAEYRIGADTSLKYRVDFVLSHNGERRTGTVYWP